LGRVRVLVPPKNISSFGNDFLNPAKIRVASRCVFRRKYLQLSWSEN
jgi:hypothetical protein